MPELPEVESTVRYLQERVVDRTIVSSAVYWARTVATHTPIAFSGSVAGVTIEAVIRRGKFIGLKLRGSSEQYLFVHLRMSGSLDVIAAQTEIATHDRVILELNNGKSIRFNDTRKFGRMYLCDSPEQVVGNLGVEPLSDDFSPELLYAITRGKKTCAKALLLDQRAIAGLGNIYVDESLWKAKIHPLTPVAKLTQSQCVALHAAITSTLEQAIALSGTDFGDGVVQDGMYSPLVYARDDEPCNRCGGSIRKSRVQQRGTHYCPQCQRAPRKSRRA